MNLRFIKLIEISTGSVTKIRTHVNLRIFSGRSGTWSERRAGIPDNIIIVAIIAIHDKSVIWSKTSLSFDIFYLSSYSFAVLFIYIASRTDKNKLNDENNYNQRGFGESSFEFETRTRERGHTHTKTVCEKV